MAADRVEYLIYVSESKVEMLYEQIRRQRSRNASRLASIASQLEIKLRGVQLSFRSKREETLYGKLWTVVEYLEQTGKVGTIEEPRMYFKGTLPACWTSLEDADNPTEVLAYFSSNTYRTIVGLGGSARHMVGIPSTDETPSRPTPAVNKPRPLRSQHLGIMQGLAGSVGLRKREEFRKFLDDVLKKEITDIANAGLTDVDIRDASTRDNIGLIEVAARAMHGPLQYIEFCAIKLLNGVDQTKGERRPVLLGSPIYVALADKDSNTLVGSRIETLFCRACGKTLLQSVKYCSDCGAPVDHMM